MGFDGVQITSIDKAENILKTYNVPLLFVLSTCEKESDNGKDIPCGEKVIESSHFVSAYVDVKSIGFDFYCPAFQKDRALFHIVFNRSDRGGCIWAPENGYIWAPEMASEPNWPYSEDERVRYLELAEKNNDLTCTDGWVAEHPNICPTEPFRAIHVVCSSHAIDDAHPAGASLDDIVKVDIRSWRDYIRNSYESGPATRTIFKHLADLTLEDLDLFDAENLYLELEKRFFAAPGDYEFVVTMTSESGKTFEAEYTLSLGLTEAE